ncbi:MAG: mechanosensitive ion channel domain-containing protein [Candidatus Binatia bacterium]
METDFVNVGEASAALVELVSTWGIKVVGAIAVLVVGRIIAGSVRRGLGKALARAKVDTTLIPFTTSLAYYAVMAFVLVAVLGLFGIPTASFIAVLGAAGLAVGLALQGTLGNFASGVMLLVFRPFKVGDFVEAGGVAGSVTAIGVFSTTLNTGDNVQITLPNGAVFGQTIKNYAANPTRRNDMIIGVGYDDDLGIAIDTIKKVVTADARVLKDPEPLVAVAELGDSSVNLVVRPWCKKEDYWGLRFDLTRALKEELEKAGCSIPYPQRDIHVFTQDTETRAA